MPSHHAVLVHRGASQTDTGSQPVGQVCLDASALAALLCAVRFSRPGPVADTIWMVGLFVDVISRALGLSSTTWLDGGIRVDVSRDAVY